MSVLKDVLVRQFAAHADRVAVGDASGSLTYRELGAAAERFAATIDMWWKAGGSVGDAADGDRVRVAVYAANSARYIATYTGLLHAGMVPFLLDPALGAEEITTVVAECGIDAFVHDRELPGEFAQCDTTTIGGLRVTRVSAGSDRPRPALLGTTEVCRFTSGSTGSPSCIEFSGTAVHNAAKAWREATGLSEGERVLCFAGLFNGLAFNTSLLPAFLAGASLWVPSGLPSSGHVIRFLKQVTPTRLTGFPALYESLLRRDADIPELADLRSALSSAAPLKAETARALRERFSLSVCNYYGVAEAGPLTYDPEPGPDRGVGYPLPGVEFAFGGGADSAGDESMAGEIRVRSSSMGSRYLNAPGVLEGRLDADGFYRTGDGGLLESGRLVLKGRVGKAINLGGRKIDPAEVRAVLAECGATESAVFSVDKRNGDPMLVAVVAGSEGLTGEQLRARCLRRLAAYKVPERFLVVDRLPKTSLGKPRLSAARQLFAETQDGPTI
ncbi:MULTISPECIES: class I adenylate-forming enzyme family protein [unclassified Streptomyces]|uniref:class I adenylate-forming enzyme family protein n=1 Tax=unclassified Streptomyces TaxID=2593676 RepID=UPI000689562A|nr:MULTISPECIES: class I adenylate-forming enzyme family protein [unclassified Streptomyces]